MIRRGKQTAYAKQRMSTVRYFDGSSSRGTITFLVTGPLLAEKAKQLAQIMGLPEFQPSGGWIDRWKTRHGIKFLKIQGEKAAADFCGAEDWIENELQSAIANYEPNNIFNGDETGLFFKATPTGTLAFSGSDPKGGKIQKERLTVLIVANMDGSEKLAYVIGKYANPRCLKRARATPLPYFSSRNAWMTAAIWENILDQLNHKMALHGRKIVLLVDNATVHRSTKDYSNLKVVFLPKNTTSLIQPLDQGVIRTMKSYYRTQLVRKIMAAIESGMTIQEFTKSKMDILTAMYMLKRALFLVKPSTVTNCFKKARIVKQNAPMDIDPGDEPAEVPPTDLSPAAFEQWISSDADLPCFGEETSAPTLTRPEFSGRVSKFGPEYYFAVFSQISQFETYDTFSLCNWSPFTSYSSCNLFKNRVLYEPNNFLEHNRNLQNPHY